MNDAKIYQLKLTLDESRPPIWRRIQAGGDLTLAELHRVIQITMGWTNSHLHQFIVGRGEYYGVSDPHWGPEIKDEKQYRLDEIASDAKSKFLYEYDFGDSWLHKVVVEKILDPEPGVLYPRCLKGKRACPPEDCGGVGGYENFLEAIKDPDHPEHEDFIEWIGGRFDSEAFDPDRVNRLLSRCRFYKAYQGPKNEYTERQGQYLAFIYYYTKINGCPPAQSDIGRYFQVTPAAIAQMLKTLEKQGFIARVPRQARSIRLLFPRKELPDLK